MSTVYPVIHYLNTPLALEQASIAHDAGAPGVFLISHYGDDSVLVPLALQIKERLPELKVGLNYLSRPVLKAFQDARANQLDMVWGDNCGVSSQKSEHTARELAQLSSEEPHIEVFASVAFKYQALERNPALAAQNAQRLGFIPTTSGAATGSAPDLDKIMSMSLGVNYNQLAVASGMDLGNVEKFKPYLTHILVATGVSKNDHEFDYEKLYAFIAKAK